MDIYVAMRTIWKMLEKKIIEAANSAAGCYSIDNINFDIKPLPLKRPTGKCTLWELNKDIVNEFIKSFE